MASVILENVIVYKFYQVVNPLDEERLLIYLTHGTLPFWLLIKEKFCRKKWRL